MLILNPQLKERFRGKGDSFAAFVPIAGDGRGHLAAASAPVRLQNPLKHLQSRPCSNTEGCCGVACFVAKNSQVSGFACRCSGVAVLISRQCRQKTIILSDCTISY